VPEGWAWCRLNQIGNTNIGLTYHPTDLVNTGTPVLRANNIQNDKLCFEELARVQTKILDNQYVANGDILICARNGSKSLVGKCTIINSISEKMAFGAFMAIFRSPYNKYIYRYLQSNYFKDYLRDSNSTQIYQLTQAMLKNALIPLPPVNEQNVITNFIEKLFQQIETIEHNKNSLESIVKQTKSKILDLAIHGKLVPQDPNDEPAEELLNRIATSDNRPYKKIDEDETLFDIPESWSWCTLGEIYTHTTGKALKKTNNKGTLRKYITTSNLYWNSFDFTEVREMYFTDDELEKCTIKKGDLILCNGGDVGRAAIWNYDYDICYQNHVSRLRPKDKDINNSFFLYLIMIYKQQGMLNGKGVGITSLSASDLLSAVIPLPPYQEQRRIVTKIEELFKNLDEILQNLLA